MSLLMAFFLFFDFTFFHTFAIHMQKKQLLNFIHTIHVRRPEKQLERQLWNIANTLRGKMDADEFRDYILGFIFYKYLSEKMHNYADSILNPAPLNCRFFFGRC